jgi:DNA invertase Pin-like site-specific DNA recombinase
MIEVFKRVAIYARVSTSRDQKPEVQIDELRRYCQARGWEVVGEIVDRGYSGKTDQRPGFKELMVLARTRKIDIVVVVKLDRLFRSLKHIVLTTQEFKDLGVQFVSLRDQIDMTTSAGQLMLHLLAAMAEFELSLGRERTMAGLDHARSKGKRLGRPPTSNVEGIKNLRTAGMSFRNIMKELGCSMGAVNRALGGAPKTGPESAKNKTLETGVSEP